MKTPLKCLRVMPLLLGVALVASACVPFVGDGPDDETPTPDVIPTVIRPTQEASQAPVAASPIPTLVPLPTRGPQATTAPPSCTPRTDWPQYTVQSGDTLYSIATRTDSTAEVLQAANCLSDPNKIFEGQELRVPQQPATQDTTPTAAPAATQSPFFPTPTPGTGAPADTGGVEFTLIAAQNSATVDNQGSYRAAQDPVYLSVLATNAVGIEVVRADGKVLGSAQAPTGVTNAGGTFALRRLDTLEGSNSLIVTVRARTTNNTVVESAPVRVYWP